LTCFATRGGGDWRGKGKINRPFNLSKTYKSLQALVKKQGRKEKKRGGGYWAHTFESNNAQGKGERRFWPLAISSIQFFRQGGRKTCRGKEKKPDGLLTFDFAVDQIERTGKKEEKTGHFSNHFCYPLQWTQLPKKGRGGRGERGFSLCLHPLAQWHLSEYLGLNEGGGKRGGRTPKPALVMLKGFFRKLLREAV